MTTLTEFLLDCIAEDEVLARFDRDVIAPLGDLQELASTKRAYGEVGYLAAHLLADCEAKRRIVERLVGADSDRSGDDHEDAAAYYALRGACQDLALPYADHPDYREEWQP